MIVEPKPLRGIVLHLPDGVKLVPVRRAVPANPAQASANTFALLAAKSSAYAVDHLGLKQDPGILLCAATEFIDKQSHVGENRHRLS
jgi:hypothetical protein